MNLVINFDNDEDWVLVNQVITEINKVCGI